MQIEQISPIFNEKYILQPKNFSKEIENYKEYINSMISAYHNSSVDENIIEDILHVNKQLAQVKHLLI